tara:strand:+ start:611 stop:1120 length:510 start_codon:yes stop_codon:yes gene_type:complete
MITFRWEGEDFYTLKNVLEEKDRQIIKNDIIKECLRNYVKEYPKFQSYPDLHIRYSSSSWKRLIKKVSSHINTIKKVKLMKCWANYINEESEYSLHVHPVGLSCVYYLQNIGPQYGTYFLKNNKEIITLGHQNSFQIFNGNISHEIVFPPPEILRQSPRLSVVFDFKYN